MPYKNIEDKRAWRMRSYYKNKEKELERGKEYVKHYKNTYQYKKTRIISNWKHNGLIETDDYTYDELYEAYYYIIDCEACGKQFKNTKDRHMDHCHKTGIFRDVVCCRCNVLRRYADLN